MKQEIKDLLQNLPEKPGIYKFLDESDNLIYVGKAKNIKKRVNNYFNKLTHLDSKTQKLVTQVKKIDYTIVNTEFDALLLENSLIKSYQPKYNILLKDDKSFPFICITNERFPRLISTRRFDIELGSYYGPYTSVKAMNTVIELIRKLFFLRTCTYNLSQKNIEEKKFKICLEYHIGNCKGPCEGLITEEEYNHNIVQIKSILKGEVNYAKNFFVEKMEEASEKMEFEKAQLFKNKIDLLEKFQNHSVIVNTKITDLEVYSIISDEKTAAVNYLKIINGTINQTKNIEIKKKLNESDEDLLLHALMSNRSELISSSQEIITNIPVNYPDTNISIVIPQKGDKKKLLDISLKNTRYYLDKLNEGKENKPSRILQTLQKDLQLPSLPNHIECFDNSNIQGSNPVAAMVYFRNGKPFKKDYRHFNIKTVQGPNDFESMYEIVTRRYKRLNEENISFPDLIVIDGGKGQLSAAIKALKELNIYGQIPLIGLAKKLEEIYFPEDNDPIHIDKKSESLKLLQQIRNEAHRFAITFHRDKRSKSSFQSQLVKISGISDASVQKLLLKFKTISNIKKASVTEIGEIIGLKKALKLKDQIK